MRLNGIAVSGKEVLHENFSFKGVWQAIEPASAPYRETLHTLPGSLVNIQIHRLLDYLEGINPLSPLPENLLSDGEIREDILTSWLCTMGREEFWSKNQAAVRELLLPCQGLFADRAATLLCLFLLLHIQADRLLGEAAEDQGETGTAWELEELNHFTALGFMKRRLLQECVLEKREDAKKGRICLKQEAAGLSLPYYRGTEGTEGPLELVAFENAGETPVLLTLDNTSLRRQLFPGERICALRKGQKYVDFLPGFLAAEEKCLIFKEGKLMWYEEEGEGTAAAMRFAEPLAAWAYDAAFGFLAVDEEGRLSARSLEPVEEPELRAVGVYIFGSRYALCLEDGTLSTNIWEIRNWENLLGIALGLNNAVGIREDRTLVLAAGEGINPEEKERAACARVFEEHLIWLDTRGSVHTEQRGGQAWSAFRRAAAVDICQYGYIVAWEDGIYRIPFGCWEGKGEEETPFVKTGKPVIELSASDMLLAYRTLDDPAVHLLQMQK